jgi:predicted nucleic acid-binding protein
MHRIILDTNVLISALRSRGGASFRPIGMLGDPRWQPIVSVALILEYEAVAKREAGRLGLADWVVESIVDMFCRLGWRQFQDEIIAWIPQCCRNTKDFRGSETYGGARRDTGRVFEENRSWPDDFASR